MRGRKSFLTREGVGVALKDSILTRGYTRWHSIFSDLCFLLNQYLHNHTVHINDDHILLFFSLVCVDCYTLNWLIVCTLYKSCK